MVIRRAGLYVLAMFVFGSSSSHSVTFETVNGKSWNPGVIIESPNTAFGEEFGEMPWIVRSGTTFPAIYQFKDRNQGNTAWIEIARLWVRKSDNTWIVYDGATWPPCSEKIGSDFSLYHFGRGTPPLIRLTDPEFNGYTTGDTIVFRFEIRFRDDPFCNGPPHTVNKSQTFQVIKGQSLPLYSGQVSVNLHGHSFFTDNVGEWGGAYSVIPGMAKAVGLRIYQWTDHGYDFSNAECSAMESLTESLTSTDVLVLPGVEGNIDRNSTNETPEQVIHAVTNVCLRTPSEIPGVENFSTRLWTLSEFRSSVAGQNGWWLAAHPFSRVFIPQGAGEAAEQWTSENVNEALADSRFLGFQIWNRPRSSTLRNAGDLNVLNPYPWTQDPEARQELHFSLGVVDSLQQSHLDRRVSILAGADNHGDYAYSLVRNRSGQIEIHNSALGKCFTVTEILTVSEAELWPALLAGRLYVTNGPGCRFGVDYDGDGLPETTFGEVHQTGQGGTIRLLGQSNGEFGPFIRAIIYVVKPTSRDSTVFPLSGMSANVGFPVSNLESGPAAVRARFETAGGYGDGSGLVLTGWLYFNTALIDVPRLHRSVAVFSIGPNPATTHVSFSWSNPETPAEIVVHDVSGRRVWTTKPFPSTTNVVWYTEPQLSAGVYFIAARYKTKIMSRRIVLLR